MREGTANEMLSSSRINSDECAALIVQAVRALMVRSMARVNAV
jgi:hypothetical protein